MEYNYTSVTRDDDTVSATVGPAFRRVWNYRPVLDPVEGVLAATDAHSDASEDLYERSLGTLFFTLAISL